MSPCTRRDTLPSGQEDGDCVERIAVCSEASPHGVLLRRESVFSQEAASQRGHRRLRISSTD